MNDTPENGAKRRKVDAMYQKSRRLFPGIAELTAEELQRMLAEQDVLLTDVRTPQEQSGSMMRGAIPGQEFEADRKEYEGRTVVCYCTMGERSGKYTRELQAQGWNAFNLMGSILAWTHVGGPLINGEGPTNRLHVHSRGCNLAADGYEAIW
ncbi:MAG: rhodanese-like domain-containing protein [Planctomycetota bacterium]